LLPAGSCPTVGIAGQALGGGVGFAGRKFGTTSDNLAAATLITADGSKVVCSAATNADLFWACRGGGGGNFGVVTALRFRVHAAPAASFFVVTWPWQQAAAALEAWQRFAPHAPDELFSICSLETGGPRVQAFGQFFGASSTLRRRLSSLVRIRGATLRVGSLPFLDLQLRWAGCLGRTVAQCHLVGQTPEGTLHRSAFSAKSDYVSEPLSPRALDTVVAWMEEAEKVGFGSAALLCDSYGGVLNRVPPAATAFVHRQNLFSAQYLAYWRTPASKPLAVEWLRGFHDAMRPHVSGFAYQNYIDPELTTWKHAYYGANLARLIKVKASVDPDRFFNFAQAIPAR
jgi:Berberine and berberine like